MSNTTPAWLAEVTKLNSPELSAAIQEAERQGGNQGVITNTKTVGIALAAVAEAMEQ